MSVARPADLEELASLLGGRGPAAGPLAITGSDLRPAEAVPRAAAAEGAGVVTTAAFAGVLAYEPRDLVVTVGAGTRLDQLRETLAGEGQWLPPAEPGTVDRLPGTAGGLVAAAPPGPFDAAYGPLRRGLLACRLVASDGSVFRWGRPVMKDVAGYALHSLCAGSHGRLGVLVSASFRTWPAPEEEERWRLIPGPDGDPLAVGAAWASGPAREAPLPDAAVWRWRRKETEEGRLEVRLVGSPESVAARRRRLRAWAETRRARLEPEPGPVASAAPSPGAADETPDRDRSLERVVLRLGARPRDLPALVERVREALPGLAAAEAFPFAGVVRCACLRDPASSEVAEGIRLLGRDRAGGVAVDLAVERGGPAEHAAAEDRRDPEVAALESRIVEALGGGPRSWSADYL